MLLTPKKLQVLLALETCKEWNGGALKEIFKGLNLEDIHINGLTFLMVASINANFEVVKFLVKNGASANTKMAQGLTAQEMTNILYEKTKDVKYISIIRFLDNFI